MGRCRGAFAFGWAFALVFSVGLNAQDTKKQEDAAKKEAQALSKLADSALAAAGGANDFNVTWVKEDFLRGPQDKQFVPFTISLDPTKVTGDLTVYWRVVPTPAAAPAAAEDKDKKDEKVKPIWEGAGFVSLAGAANPFVFSRSFNGPAGSYDVYVVTKELQIDKPRNAPPAKTVVLKKTLAVPDFWNNELASSSVIVYERIEPLAAPLTNQQQTERPYAMGTAEIIPYQSLKLTKKNELATLLFIYNPKGDAANKPDITVEYSFCQAAAPDAERAPDDPCKPGEKFYNKTNPESLNGTTLDPAFDVNLHQIQTGQGVPLATFPEGNYRLEIKITDKLANKTIVKDVNFSVSAS